MKGIEENSTIATALLPILKNRRSGIGFAQQKETGGYRVVSWCDYAEEALRLSAYLEKQGITAGDRVLILSENCPEWGMAALAAANLGAILVPVASMSTHQELASLLQQSRAKFCFFSKTAQAYRLIDKKILPENFAWDIQSKSPLEPLTAGLAPCAMDPNRISADATAVLIFTSGTTGNPKAVPLSHRNVLVNMRDATDAVPADETDVVVSVLPMSHMFEFTGGFLFCIDRGVKVAYVKSLRAEDILQAMRDNGCTVLLAVPLLFEVIARTLEQRLADLPKPLALFFGISRKLVLNHQWLGKILLFPLHKAFGGKVRFFLAGGAKLQPWVYDFFQSIGLSVLQGYGLTETSPVLAVSELGTSGPNHVGKPLRSVELGIFDGDGKALAAGSEGEVWAKGSSVFRGYENPEHNKSAFSGDWFRTGDLGRFTPEGFLEITGRKKDIIVTPGGKNVYPEEIEATLSRTGKFLEVCVLGLKDEQGHEKVTAVLRPDRAKFRESDAEKLQVLVEQAILDALREFSDYMQPQRVVVYEKEFPKTHTRKVKRFELRDLILSGEKKTERSHDTLDALDGGNSLERTVGEAIAAIVHKPFEKINRSDKLVVNLGLDSLTFVEILSTVERRFNLKVDSVEFGGIETVADLLQKVEKLLAEQGKSSSVVKKVPLFSEFSPLAGLSLQWRVPRLILNRLVRWILLVYCRISSVGRAQIAEADAPLIFAANHTSHFDSLSIVSTLPYRHLRKTFAVAAKDYFFDKGWKSFLFRITLNAIPFDRKKRVDEGMKKCREIIDHGGSLIIFPEGTRSPDGKLQAFKPGVGTLVCGNSKARVVPVYIDGAFRVFPKGGRLPRPNKLRVVYGTPISFADLTPTPENYGIVAKRLQAEVQKLKDQLS